MKTHRRQITIILLAVFIANLLSGFTNPPIKPETENLPASILILDTDGIPEKIYGNKHIDWESLGHNDEPLPLNEFEAYLLSDKRSTDPTIKICEDWGLIDQNFNRSEPATTYEYLNWLCRVFFQYEYRKILYAYDEYTATTSVADTCGFTIPGKWRDNPDALLTREDCITISERFLHTYKKTIDMDILVPKTMTRYDICKIIYRLSTFIELEENVERFVYSDEPVIPIILQHIDDHTSIYNNFYGTSWRIVNNNRNETGFLSNGKPITEENIWELLTLMELAFPTGTVWTSSTLKDNAPGLQNVDNNNYNNPSKTMETLYLTGYNVSPRTACGGFASFLSDLLFGQTANPVHPVNANALHPGDVCIEKYITQERIDEEGQVKHTTFITRADNQEKLYDYADGNAAMRINWSGWHNGTTPHIKSETNYSGEYESQFLYYSRWPEPEPIIKLLPPPVNYADILKPQNNILLKNIQRFNKLS